MLMLRNWESKTPSSSEDNCSSSKVSGPMSPLAFWAGLSNGGVKPRPEGIPKIGSKIVRNSSSLASIVYMILWTLFITRYFGSK